jgi:hypothetical protein
VEISTSPVVYGYSVNGPTLTWVDPNTLHIVRYMHSVLLTGLLSYTDYYYRCGDPIAEIWSPLFKFTSLPDEAQKLPIAMYGDLGLVNSQVLASISEEVAKGKLGLAIHLGDFAYDLNELQGMTGDIFMRGLQNVTSGVPFMGVNGNHGQDPLTSHLLVVFFVVVDFRILTFCFLV